jgi:hypothetical protein
MGGILETLAFALVMAGQFLAAIVLTSRRKAIYFDSEPQASDEARINNAGQHERVKPA